MDLLNTKTLLTLRDSIREIKDLYFDWVNMEAGKMKHGSIVYIGWGGQFPKQKEGDYNAISPSHGDFKTFSSFA